MTRIKIRRLLDYQEGKMFWKMMLSRSKVGSEAGTLTKDGRWVIKIGGKNWLRHRLVWLWHHDVLPPVLDHIDSDRTNDRIENLRPATLSQNNANSKKSTINNSGIKGVSWSQTGHRWQAYVNYKGKQIYLGLFDTVEQASIARRKYFEQMYGEFARHE